MKMTDGITNVVSATGQALKNMRSASGKPTDPNVILYESLTPEVLDQMANDLGPETVLDYIREMEARRIQPEK